MRKLKVAGIVAVVILTAYVLWTNYNGRVQGAVDAQIVADIHKLIEHRLAALKVDDTIIRRYGAFKEWERGDWSRPHYLGRNVSRLDTRGLAHFERADQEVDVIITNGPERVDFQMNPTDEWFREQPEQRRLYESGRTIYLEFEGGRGQCQMHAWACHPDFVPD